MSLSFQSVTFDCVDPAALARFWSGLLDRPLDEGGSADYASIGLAAAHTGRPGWAFIKVPEPKGPKNRVHVDLGTHHLDTELTRLIDLGATQLAERNEDGVRWVTLADPEGNELDLVAITT